MLNLTFQVFMISVLFSQHTPAVWLEPWQEVGDQSGLILRLSGGIPLASFPCTG